MHILGQQHDANAEADEVISKFLFCLVESAVSSSTSVIMNSIQADEA